MTNPLTDSQQLIADSQQLIANSHVEAAIAEGYHPGVAANGTTPRSYVEAMRGLLGELGYAA